MLQVIWRIPILKNVFPDGVPIYGFGCMLFLAFVVCTWLAGRRAEREGIKKETIQDLAIWIFIGGLLGARITYLLGERPVPPLGDLIARLPRIWDGGIVLYGSVLGGLAGYALAYLLFFRKHGLSTRRLADVIAPSIAIGLCLGRMGCFLNGCCYGLVACADCAVVPISFPLSAPPRAELVAEGDQTAAGFTIVPLTLPGQQGVQVGMVDPKSRAFQAGLRPGAIITEANGHAIRTVTDLNAVLALGSGPDNWPRGQARLPMEYRPTPEAAPISMVIVPRTLGLYPTQLYEVISMALLCLVLFAYDPLRRNPGQVMAVLMVGYGLHRYLNELLRGDPRPEGFEIWGSFVCVGAGILLWVWLWRKAPDPPVKPVGEAALRSG
jgi:prolipoprotein diacylglyceryltransferase